MNKCTNKTKLNAYFSVSFAGQDQLNIQKQLRGEICEGKEPVRLTDTLQKVSSGAGSGWTVDY